MFLATTGLTQWFVLSSFDEENESLSEMRNDQSVDHPPVNLKLKALREFLDSLPKMPSHYCRKDTKKLYVEPLFKSYADLYEEYTKQNIQSMSRSSFMKEIASMGISIFHPRKDRCDICCSFDTGNIGQDDFADDWELLPLPRNDVIPVNGPDRLYSSPLKIKQSKYDDLQSLKSVLLKDAHAFYDNLPH
ncbi:hypothetical protein RRG08_034001 [Elysia crispata]|uniref:Uncharacterized protein n=1 Tax=Elysia crispata TaxID=231223 RepID=A0AAE0XR98_9GAST|nr:hypothetical protein RRG08_034001 [Elysia crispata]